MGKKADALCLEIVALERRLLEARAGHASTLGAAFDAIPKAGKEAMTASGVIIEITALGGKVVVPPVLIRDGLSAATIAAIQKDLRDSFELATMVNPAMAKLN